jgi:SAM-dependent methyltransferase
MKIQGIFDNPIAYRLFQVAISKKATTKFIENEFINPEDSTQILDFGCGVGHHSELFSGKIYLGIEPIRSCVEAANRFYQRENVEFRVGDHETLAQYQDDTFDLIMAIGVIHHLNDDEYRVLASESCRLLKPGGRFIALDPVLHAKQGSLSRWVVSKDRGEWVREHANYLTTMKEFFPDLKVDIYSKLLRIPYDHIFVTARK